MMKVYKSCCKNCLLSPDSIVSPARRKQILKDVTEKQSYFICHKATIEGKDIVCNTFFEKLGHVSQMIRISERLNMLEFVDQPEQKRLPSHSDLHS